MIAHKTSTFFFDFKNDSPALSNWRNSSGGAPNKLNHSLMCGFPPIPNCAKLLTPHGTPWRRAENPPAEVGHIVHRYVEPGGLVCDPFSGTAPIAEQTMRQGKRVLLMDRDHQILEAARVRHMQRYTYLVQNALLPPFYTNEQPYTGDQCDREIAATLDEIETHWVELVKSKGCDDKRIPPSKRTREALFARRCSDHRQESTHGGPDDGL